MVISMLKMKNDSTFSSLSLNVFSAGFCVGCCKVVWVVCGVLQGCVGSVRDVGRLCGLCA